MRLIKEVLQLDQIHQFLQLSPVYRVGYQVIGRCTRKVCRADHIGAVNILSLSYAHILPQKNDPSDQRVLFRTPTIGRVIFSLAALRRFHFIILSFP